MPFGGVSPTGTICHVVVAIRRGTDRFVERLPGRRTAHGFSFGATYDAEHVRFGPMVCHDDHLLKVGSGFPDHDHRDLVIVTWVVSGAVAHSGPAGDERLEPGQVGVLRTGAGVTHAEVAAAPQTRFVQVWLTASGDGAPSYEVATPDLVPGRLVRVAEPEPGAAFSVGRLEAQQTLTVPASPKVHVFVARGALLRSSLAEPLHDGDAFLFTDEPAHELTAGVPTDLLVWEFA
jgi:redox-sensitive bicupin YhaK (pirin superfamily)